MNHLYIEKNKPFAVSLCWFGRGDLSHAHATTWTFWATWWHQNSETCACVSGLLLWVWPVHVVFGSFRHRVILNPFHLSFFFFFTSELVSIIYFQPKVQFIFFCIYIPCEKGFETRYLLNTFWQIHKTSPNLNY